MAANVIESIADPEANIIFGTVKDMSMEDEVKVTLVAAAFPITEEVDDPEARMGIQRAPASEVQPPYADADDLDVPSFLRRGQDPRSRGFYR
jgi:cell division protein FtsZ